jgi:hypothetical protein
LDHQADRQRREAGTIGRVVDCPDRVSELEAHEGRSVVFGK